MATMELRRVPYETTFTVFGDEFVDLDYFNGGVLAIRRDIWEEAPFDTSGGNDLRNACIGRNLNEYLNILKDGGAEPGNIVTMTIDLKATDGTREYGYYQTRLGLLTLEQYGKYQHIIPDVDRPWWLATPWRTPGEKCGSSTYAWRVYSNGFANYDSCSYTYGVRPALLFNPSLLVSIEIEDEEDADIAAEREREMHERYCKYVRGWAVPDGGQELGSSPLSYENWKNWKEP